MELQLVKKYDARAWDGVVVPLGEGNLNSYQGPWEQELAAVRASGRFEGKTGEIFRFSVLSEGVLTQIFLLGLGKDWSLEQVLESCAKVYRQCQGTGSAYGVYRSAGRVPAVHAGALPKRRQRLPLLPATGLTSTRRPLRRRGSKRLRFSARCRSATRPPW